MIKSQLKSNKIAFSLLIQSTNICNKKENTIFEFNSQHIRSDNLKYAQKDYYNFGVINVWKQKHKLLIAELYYQLSTKYYILDVCSVEIDSGWLLYFYNNTYSKPKIDKICSLNQIYSFIIGKKCNHLMNLLNKKMMKITMQLIQIGDMYELWICINTEKYQFMAFTNRNLNNYNLKIKKVELKCATKYKSSPLQVFNVNYMNKYGDNNCYILFANSFYVAVGVVVVDHDPNIKSIAKITYFENIQHSLNIRDDFHGSKTVNQKMEFLCEFDNNLLICIPKQHYHDAHYTWTTTEECEFWQGPSENRRGEDRPGFWYNQTVQHKHKFCYSYQRVVYFDSNYMFC